MIRVKIATIDNEVLEGGVELIETWKSGAGGQLWLDVQSEITDEVRGLLADFSCDDLAIADASRQRHPPKIENFSGQSFIIFRGIQKIDESLNVEHQQLAIFVGENYLITLHAGESVSIQQFWKLAFESPESSEAGLIALRLLHFATGRYVGTLLEFEGQLTDLEDSLLDEKSETAMKLLVAHRSRLRRLRRIFNYHLGMARHILEEGAPQLGLGPEENYHERRDLYDRCERAHSLCSMYYEICGDLVEGYISISSHQLNYTMKVLTIITAIFVPMGFLAGLYGMNFEHMPELHFRYGYFVVLGVMVSIAAGMLVLFRRAKWI